MKVESASHKLFRAYPSERLELFRPHKTGMLRSPSLNHVWISTLNALAFSFIDLHFHFPTFHVPWPCCWAQDNRTAKLFCSISRLQGVTTPWLFFDRHFSNLHFQLTSRAAIQSYVDFTHMRLWLCGSLYRAGLMRSMSSAAHCLACRVPVHRNLAIMASAKN